ncbi:hypothetical protein [Actinopolymorpha pittospori]
MLWTWQNADVGAAPGFSGAEEDLPSIRAPSSIMPGQQDRKFIDETLEKLLARKEVTLDFRTRRSIRSGSAS